MKCRAPLAADRATFGEEPWPLAISLIVASIAVSGMIVGVGELWTSIVRMICVGSQHVGGRVNKLMWLQLERLIFMIGVVVFWTIVLLRQNARRIEGAAFTGKGCAVNIAQEVDSSPRVVLRWKASRCGSRARLPCLSYRSNSEAPETRRFHHQRTRPR